MLKLQHLTKQFGAAPLFTDLCMEVDAPLVLWAPSGWGKTTLLRVLMGLETPTSGSVQGVGRVSAVFQEDRLCPQLNAVQNVALVLPGLGMQYKEQIEICFQQLGLDSTALVLPARKLSGGQKRRVAVAGVAAVLALSLWRSGAITAMLGRGCDLKTILPSQTMSTPPQELTGKPMETRQEFYHRLSGVLENLLPGKTPDAGAIPTTPKQSVT